LDLEYIYGSDTGKEGFEKANRNFSTVASTANSALPSTDFTGANVLTKLAADNSVVPIENGGLGANTVATARNNLGLGNTSGALPIANGGTDATDSLTACNNLGITQMFSNPNLLINPFQIWQRGTSFSNPAYVYTADRWLVWNSVSSITRETNTSDAPCLYSLKLMCCSDSSYNILAQPIEDYTKLLNKTLTLSFYVRGIGGLDTVNVAILNTEKSIALTSDWQKVVFTSTPTGLFTTEVYDEGVKFSILMADDTKGYEIAGVKLELSSIATPFVPRPYAEELALCKRYGELIEKIRGIYCDIAGNIFCPINFSEKRIVPTITKFSGWGADTEGYVHYQPIGIEGTNYLSSIYETTKTTAQFILTTRGDITVTPAVGSFIITKVFIDAEIY
jgi:hypothetical protein